MYTYTNVIRIMVPIDLANSVDETSVAHEIRTDLVKSLTLAKYVFDYQTSTKRTAKAQAQAMLTIVHVKNYASLTEAEVDVPRLKVYVEECFGKTKYVKIDSVTRKQGRILTESTFESFNQVAVNN
jgi:hypothetical protein